MSKTFTTLLITILIMIVGSVPWIDGVIFKKNYLHVINIINQDNRVKIDVLEYTQGWLKSTAKVRVTLVNNGLSMPYQANSQRVNILSPITFLVEQNISHGPLTYDPLRQKLSVGYANIYSFMRLPEELSTTVLGNLKSEGVIEMSTLAQFNGDWVGEIRMPKLITTLPNYFNIVLDGLRGDYKFVIIRDHFRNISANIQFGAMQIDVRMPNLYFKQLKVAPITYVNDTMRTKTGLWSGSANLTIPGITITKSDDSLVTIGEVGLSTTYGVGSNTFYSTSLILNLYKLKLNHPVLPNMDLLHLKLSANNFNAEGLNDYINSFKSSTSVALKNTDIGMVENLLARAVMKNSEIVGSAVAKTDEGDIRLNSRTTWDDVSVVATLSDVITNSNTRIRVKASEAITKKIVQEYKNYFPTKPPAEQPTELASAEPSAPPQTPESMVQGLTKIGYIVKEKNVYSTIFTINNNELKINGRQLTH